MRILFRLAVCALVVVTPACARQPERFTPDTIIGLERAALDRWGKGDPDGYFDIMAPDVTYFDPTTDARADGKERLKALIEPLRGKISIERAELVNPTVVGQGDVAVLTFNLISHGGRLGGGPKSDVRWNCTEVYRRIDGVWKIAHSHWSYTKPELKGPAGP
ncbi:MAG: nuclear transport factor 2 family protein [Acidobacteriia bacterium]|nr:nuclear transport factor 2 family protein [Terriglobia bacterium]